MEFFHIDPLQIINSIPIVPIPDNKKLGTTHKRVTGNDLVNAHNAAIYVSTILRVFVFDPIWKERKFYFCSRKKSKKKCPKIILQY